MTTRPLRPEDWAPVSQIRIKTRHTREPRDEVAKFPKKLRPSPINILPGQPSPLARCPSALQKEEIELLESPRSPEIVDVAVPSTWSRHVSPRKQALAKRLVPPRIPKPCSARQSEISYGILDYYITDSSPLPSPSVPSPTPAFDTPVIDEAIKKLDFDLTSIPNDQRDLGQAQFDHVVPYTNPGAEQETTLEPRRTRILEQPQLQPQAKPTYSLFPSLREAALPTSPPAFTQRQRTASCTLSSNITSIPSHHQPDSSYRAQRESLCSAVRSRKDSFNSFCGAVHLPLRLSSTSSTTMTANTMTSPTSSPPSQSRWSQETIKSPAAATTPGLRTSFGSLFGRSSSQYPACFFEDDDDDEHVPLRKKLPWKQSISLTQDGPGVRDERNGGRGSLSRRVRSVMLCSGCCG